MLSEVTVLCFLGFVSWGLDLFLGDELIGLKATKLPRSAIKDVRSPNRGIRGN